MPQRVVDGLEFIKIKHHHGGCATIPPKALTRFFKLRIEFCAVSKSRQYVMPRRVSDLSLRAPPFGNILVCSNPAAFFHWLPRDKYKTPIRKLLNSAGGRVDRNLIHSCNLVLNGRLVCLT